MRIVHVIGTLDPAAGGPPQVVARLSSAQAALGNDVTVVSTNRDEVRPAVMTMLSSIPGVHRVKLADADDADATARVMAAAQAVHLHGVWEPLLLRVARSARRAGIPYVVRPAGMLDPWSLAQKKWKKRIALALGYRRMLDGAAFIHALNADEARLIGPLGLKCPIEVIPNGVFLEEIEPPGSGLPAPGTFRGAHPELGDDPFVLFLSRLHYKKGLDILADAFARVAASDPKVRLVVAGPDEGARGDFEKRIAAAESKLGGERNFRGRTHVIGPVYGRAKYEAMVDAACFCLPSRQEGFSVAITEALAVGCPAVITENCHFPEVAEVGAGEVTPLDAGAVADALLRVLSDPRKRQGMGEAGRKLVRERYTWPAIAERTVELYERFGDGSSGS
jgi:glycosyltransferase involved in cell wall biosynthesis